MTSKAKRMAAAKVAVGAAAATAAPTRREHDLLGERDVPVAAYYGVHTLRALENFPITGTPVSMQTWSMRWRASSRPRRTRTSS